MKIWGNNILFMNQILIIDKFTALNGYGKYIGKSILANTGNN